MKKQLVVMLLGAPFLSFAAAGIDIRDIEDEFQEMKLGMSKNMASALDMLSERKVSLHFEGAQSLLDFALRAPGDNKNMYVDRLVDLFLGVCKDKALKEGSMQNPALRKSKTYSLLDVAIMQGNVENVKKYFCSIRVFLKAS